ncbi:MAG TPA: gamma-glutamyl-phosphate reductase, partial [Stellaceae bacterium]|nr:gamma-glutamyl-phosphate reductase [Stellaceae bacterium]
MTTDTLARERTQTPAADLMAEMVEIGRRARGAALALALASAEAKTAALCNAARAIRARADEILAANAGDLAEAAARGVSPALRDRLALDPKRLETVAAGLEAIAALPDP